MTKQLSDEEMAAKAAVMRVRGEAGIVRAMWLNKVLPVIEGELNRRLAEGESVNIELPEVNTFAKAYLESLNLRPQLNG